MTMLAKVAAASALLASIAAGSAVLAFPAKMEAKAILMSPGKALELQIGDQHSISYFQPAANGCSLTFLLADGQPGEGGQEAHGTRIVMPIAPGETVRIDGTQRKSADFVCGPKGKKMNAKVYDRETYKSAAAPVSQ